MMTVFAVIQVFLVFAIILQWVYVEKKLETLRRQDISLATNYKALEDLIERVDNSLGRDVSELRQELTTFENDFGEAAIEEKRQAAKAEKAWADGVNSIMSYGTHLQGGGNSR